MTIYLHIGLNKTGSSSLQAFCDEPRPALRTSGSEYPEVGVHDSAHHGLSRLYLRRHDQWITALYTRVLKTAPQHNPGNRISGTMPRRCSGRGRSKPAIRSSRRAWDTRAFSLPPYLRKATVSMFVFAAACPFMLSQYLGATDGVLFKETVA